MEIDMKRTLILPAAAMALTMVATLADATPYAVSGASKKVVRNNYGECWQNINFKKEDMTKECGAPDSDGDGVIDAKDQCPGTPKGVNVDAAGCPLDGDRDGVTNDKDACPDTPKGRTVNRMGCQLDGDNDGVYNDDDTCPNTPAGQNVNPTGCSTIKVSVFFNSAKSDLSADAVAKLKAAAKALSDRGITNVTALGYADPRGDANYNKRLSMKRAQAVQAFLSGNGVAAEKIAVDARGETNSGNLPRDRRVDVIGKPSGQ